MHMARFIFVDYLKKNRDINSAGPLIEILMSISKENWIYYMKNSYSVMGNVIEIDNALGYTNH